MTVLGPYIDTLRRVESRQIVGAVHAVRGLTVLAGDLPLPVGATVGFSNRRRGGAAPVARGEVIGFDGDQTVIMLFDHAGGIAPGMRVAAEQTAPTVQVGRCLLGRVIDGLARPVDGGPRPADTTARPLHPPPTPALHRKLIDGPLPTGVRAVDAMVTMGKGQRMGVFSGPGIGKSTLLATIARNTSADVNVIALVGERGREVREFLDTVLGPEGLARSVLVVATSDESALLWVRAAAVACAVAEHFRELGADVMLMMDSITRLAQAQRQIGLSVGEPPATKGYTPSVFAMLPKLLERAGVLEQGGSITGLYAVLVEGDDLTEPVSDAARGILDGHVSLSRRIAARGHYPAIDLLESISRVADDVCDEHHVRARRTLRRLLAAHADAEELINIGAYERGSNPDCDVAIELKPALERFFQQETMETAAYPETCRTLIELALDAEARLAKLTPAGVGRSLLAPPSSASP